MLERIQLSRAKGWRMPPNTVNVARPGKWGNRFRIGDTAEVWGDPGVVRFVPVKDAATAVDLFRQWLRLNLEQHPKIMQPALDELRGKNLACWCKPGEPCHADVLLELANAPDGVMASRPVNDLDPGDCPELNLSNYDADDVAELNGWAVQADACIERLTRERNEFHTQAQHAQAEIREAHAAMDTAGFPRLQPSNFPYSLTGRVRAGTNGVALPQPRQEKNHG